MKILVLNSGSSSVKCQYFHKQESVASLLIERIGEKESHSEIVYTGQKIENHTPLANHLEALEMLFSLLLESAILSDIQSLDAVGHRVVHGGILFQKAVRINDKVIEDIRSLIPLAPLHNPANLQGIEVLYQKFPSLPQVAVFDTAFHQSMPEYAYRYALPYALSNKLHIRRYGFHGTSHSYVAKEAANMLNKPLTSCNLITLHLGNGASVAAIKTGKSVDTSMGMTPLEGLIMGTRSGDIDPAIIPYLETHEAMSADQIDTLLNKKSGLKGICGSNDMREILSEDLEGDTKSCLALEMYAYRIRKYIGAYTVTLGKVDAIIFTGGIGEHASKVRELVCDSLFESIGIEMDKKKNENVQNRNRAIESQRSKIKLLVIPTNEEMEIALQTEALLK